MVVVVSPDSMISLRQWKGAATATPPRQFCNYYYYCSPETLRFRSWDISLYPAANFSELYMFVCIVKSQRLDFWRTMKVLCVDA